MWRRCMWQLGAKAEILTHKLKVYTIWKSGTSTAHLNYQCLEWNNYRLHGKTHNSLGSVLAALSGLPRCRRELQLEARGRPVGPAVKSTHQSSAAVSCLDCPPAPPDAVAFVLHYCLSLPSLSIWPKDEEQEGSKREENMKKKLQARQRINEKTAKEIKAVPKDIHNSLLGLGQVLFLNVHYS